MESPVTPRRSWLVTPLALVFGVLGVMKFSEVVLHIEPGLGLRLQPHLLGLAPRLLNIRHRPSVSLVFFFLVFKWSDVLIHIPFRAAAWDCLGYGGF